MQRLFPRLLLQYSETVDLVVCTGGVSVGEKNYMETAGIMNVDFAGDRHAAGLNAHLAKPLDIEKVKTTICSQIRKRNKQSLEMTSC